MFVFGRPATRQNMEEGKNEGFKKEILKDLFDRGMIEDKKGPLEEKVIYYPAVIFADLKKFQDVLAKQPYADLLSGDVSKYIEYKNSAEGMKEKSKTSIKRAGTGKLEVK